MGNDNDRFIEVYKQSKSLGSEQTRIFVDKETGINYLFITSGYCGGLTPLLDAYGKPVVTPII